MTVVGVMQKEPSEVLPRLKHPVWPVERVLCHNFVGVRVEDDDLIQTCSLFLHLVKDLAAKEEE